MKPTFSMIPVLAAIVLVLAGAALHAERDAGAQEGIDLSGNWHIDVGGNLELSCMAAVTQTGSDFSMALTCPTLGSGTVSGTIDVVTGDFAASGTVLGITVALVGAATADGNSMTGSWDSQVGFSGPFVGIRKEGEPSTPTPLPTFPSPVDISGTWRITYSGLFSGTCEAAIEQEGSELRAVADCDLIGSLRLSGSIEPATGAFSVSGGGIALDGVVAADGNTLTGTWDAFSFISGTLTGARATDIELIDLAGAWEVVLGGDIADQCALQIEQSLVSASANLVCDTIGSGDLTGSISPFTGGFSFFGPLEDGEVSLQGSGTLEDGYLRGWWFTGGQSGTFVAVPEGSLALGIVAVDCAPLEPALNVDCGYDVDDELLVSITVVAPPSGGYRSLQAGLSWSGAVLNRVPVLYPAVVEDCPAHPVGVQEESADFACLVTGPAPATSAGDVFSILMTCSGEGESALSLPRASDGDQGTQFTGEDGAVVTPTLIDAAVTCYDPSHGGPGFLLPGDSDCSGDTDSVDASLVLQLEAGLIDELACDAFVDVNRDQRVNSIDASLILQLEAGLLDRLPTE